MRARRAHRVPPWRPTESRSRPPSRAIDRDAIDRAPPPSSTSSPSASRDDDATTDRSSLDDEDIETIFSSRLRHRLRLRTVRRVVGRAPPSPHPRHPHRITRSRSRPYVRSIARASPIARTRADRRPSHRAVSFRVERDAPSFLRACVRVTTRARRVHSQSINHQRHRNRARRGRPTGVVRVHRIRYRYLSHP